MKITSNPTDENEPVQAPAPKAKKQKQPKADKPARDNLIVSLLDPIVSSPLAEKFPFLLDFNGESERKMFWIVGVPTSFVFGISMLFVKTHSLLTVLGVLLMVATIYIHLTNITRRLNDLQWSKWLLLIPGIPFTISLLGGLIGLASQSGGSSILTLASIMSIITIPFNLIIGFTGGKTE